MPADMGLHDIDQVIELHCRQRLQPASKAFVSPRQPRNLQGSLKFIGEFYENLWYCANCNQPCCCRREDKFGADPHSQSVMAQRNDQDRVVQVFKLSYLSQATLNILRRRYGRRLTLKGGWTPITHSKLPCYKK